MIMYYNTLVLQVHDHDLFIFSFLVTSFFLDFSTFLAIVPFASTLPTHIPTLKPYISTPNFAYFAHRSSDYLGRIPLFRILKGHQRV